jgi:hypothetical protein
LFGECQRAAAQSSLTDRINLSIAEAFVNVGSLTRLNLHIRRRPRNLCVGGFFFGLATRGPFIQGRSS